MRLRSGALAAPSFMVFTAAGLGQAQNLAYNAKDGSLAWTFYTVPGPGEPGHETWPKDSDAWTRGGANIWQTPAVGPELGLIPTTGRNNMPTFKDGYSANQIRDVSEYITTVLPKGAGAAK